MIFQIADSIQLPVLVIFDSHIFRFLTFEFDFLLIYSYCRFFLPCQLLSFPGFPMSTCLVLTNKHCNSLTICNYSTLQIGNSVISGLSHYTNTKKRNFKPLNAINCVGWDRVQNILWRNHNLLSSPYLHNVAIMCGTK